MRRLIFIAAFTLFLAVPLWAQHGGGHGGGGGHAGGFGGGHGGGFAGHSGFSGGHVGGGHFSGGMHRSPGFSRGFNRGFHSGFSSRGFRGRGPIISNFGFRHGRRWGWNRWGWGWPWWYSGFYDPYWWWDSGSSYDEAYERDRDRAERMNAQSLEEQRMLRQEEADGDQDVYARPSPAPGPSEAQGVPMMPATVLIFRDQHTQEVQNYAIVGQTLWSFAPQRTEKILLADLDLQATTKANDDRGITFRVPSSGEAQ